MEKLEARGALSPDGKDWLIQALDPFFDGQHPIAGYPDQYQGKSVVQCVTQTLAIRAPAVAGVSNWDCHVMFLDDLRDSFYNNQFDVASSPFNSFVVEDSGRNLNIRSGGQYLLTKSYPYRAPVNIVSCITGNTTTPSDSGWQNGTAAAPLHEFNGFDLSLFGKDQCRIIAGGLEVVNTTAELYKGGSVIVYEMGQTLTDEYNVIRQNFTSATNYQQTATYGMRSRVPPQSPNQAMLLPGAAKWGAEDGCYLLMKQSKSDNPPEDDVRTYHRWGNGAQLWNEFPGVFNSRGFGMLTQQDGSWNDAGSLLVNNGHCACPVNHPIPYDTTGAYFVGLNTNSVLEVTLRIFIEVFPTPANTSLVVMASPSPAFDPLAMEIYSQVLRELPPGVPVTMNPNGEWWEKVLLKISELAPLVGTALNNVLPGAGIIGSGIAMAAKGGAGLIDANLKRKQDKRVANRPPPAPKKAITNDFRAPAPKQKKGKNKIRG